MVNIPGRNFHCEKICFVIMPFKLLKHHGLFFISGDDLFFHCLFIRGSTVPVCYAPCLFLAGKTEIHSTEQSYQTVSAVLESSEHGI
jgi:hypothetical protein